MILDNQYVNNLASKVTQSRTNTNAHNHHHHHYHHHHHHHHHYHHHLHVHHLLFRRGEPQGLHGRQKVLELGLWKSFEFSHLRAFVYREQ